MRHNGEGDEDGLSRIFKIIATVCLIVCTGFAISTGAVADTGDTINKIFGENTDTLHIVISKLDSSGIQVQRMDVFCSDSGQQQNPDFSNGGSPRQQYNRRTGLLSRKTEPEKIEACGLYMQLEDSSSSVEYRI